VIVTEEQRDLIQPGGVALFAFDASAALEYARRFLEEQRFRPDDLDEMAALLPARPVFLPFWTFEVGGQITWRGFSPEEEFGRVRLVPAEGALGAVYEEVLVPGTRSLPEEQSAGLSYDTSALAPYSPDLLADWPAEIYSVALADAAVLALSATHEKSDYHSQLEVERSLGDTVRNVHVDKTDLAIQSYKLVLLPVWLTGYFYMETQYTLVINGQNGQVHGEVPRSGVQRVLGEIFGVD
jgi:hypothetical protein